MDVDQEKFLRTMIFGSTLAATLQRSRLYTPGVSGKEIGGFHQALRRRLEEIARQYQDDVDEETHICNIVELSRHLTTGQIDFRIGLAQKALNLYLKFCWCLGWIPRPPHCPFDSRIIGKLREYDGPSWTQLESAEEYRRLVSAAKVQAGDEPLTRWELREYIGTQTER